MTHVNLSLFLLLVWTINPLGVQASSNLGGNQRVEKLTNLETSYPFWSPDGSKLVFQ
jgi:hypothetical protein